MIARNESNTTHGDLWARLSAPVPPAAIMWRQDGRPIEREDRFFARFVAYVDANTVRERLDGVVPGDWDLSLELLPALVTDEADAPQCSFKARLQVLGVVREDVGMGRDYKQAATDAFKRAAVRFGIAHELYGYEQNWVQVDGTGKFAHPLEEPADAYARARVRRSGADSAEDEQSAHRPAATGPRALDEPSCPKCGGRMWDNRLSKRNPKAPDFKCRSRSCDGVIWPAPAAASGQAELEELSEENGALSA
jgi:hypothetical protein